MTDMTPAQAQAARLARIATHLLAHPDLSDVVVHRGHLQITATDEPAALLAWADSMTGPRLRVQVLKNQAFCYVIGSFFGQPETVWTVVHGFAAYVDGETNLDTLRAFASRLDGEPC